MPTFIPVKHSFENMQEDKSRLAGPKMAYYRKVFRNSKRWDGKVSLEGKRVIVYGEQGYGDIIQFARYLAPLKTRGCEVIVYCPKDLHRLMLCCAGVDGVLDKDDPNLPAHDFHTLSMSLPFQVGVQEESPTPYFNVPGKTNLGPEHEGYYKIGIAWEGNPEHASNHIRSCPLKLFKNIVGPRIRLFILQNECHLPSLAAGAEDMDFYMKEPGDFLETAEFVNAMDLVVSVDTAVLHMAGALGKPAFGLLAFPNDFRWHVRSWYPSVVLLRQGNSGRWPPVFANLRKRFVDLGPADLPPTPSVFSIFLTGGIGDVFALESYMRDGERAALESIYYASRNHVQIEELFRSLPLPKLRRHEVVWQDFTDRFAFFSKGEVAEAAGISPLEWDGVLDWSISIRFPEIGMGVREYNGSSFLKHTLADISRLELPDRFVVVVPHSPNDPRMRGRNFTEEEWAVVTGWLEREGVHGVILNQGDPCEFRHPRLVDLTGVTTMPESIEVLKKAEGYVGIDSCLSVLAAKLFEDKLIIKSRNPHCYRHKHIYFAPKKNFKFLVRKITAIA